MVWPMVVIVPRTTRPVPQARVVLRHAVSERNQIAQRRVGRREAPPGAGPICLRQSPDLLGLTEAASKARVCPAKTRTARMAIANPPIRFMRRLDTEKGRIVRTYRGDVWQMTRRNVRIPRVSAR